MWSTLLLERKQVVMWPSWQLAAPQLSVQLCSWGLLPAADHYATQLVLLPKASAEGASLLSGIAFLAGRQPYESWTLAIELAEHPSGAFGTLACMGPGFPG